MLPRFDEASRAARLLIPMPSAASAPQSSIACAFSPNTTLVRLIASSRSEAAVIDCEAKVTMPAAASPAAIFAPVEDTAPPNRPHGPGCLPTSSFIPRRVFSAFSIWAMLALPYTFTTIAIAASPPLPRSVEVPLQLLLGVGDGALQVGLESGCPVVPRFPHEAPGLAEAVEPADHGAALGGDRATGA